MGIVRVGGRGTSRRVENKKDDNWQVELSKNTKKQKKKNLKTSISL
jgi:hypothetical protein